MTKRYWRCAWVTFLSAPQIGLPLAIWKLNDKIISSGNMNGDRHARSRPSPQLRLGRRYRRLHPRGRARPSHAVDGEPADQAAGGESGLSAAASERQAGHADRAGRAAGVLCAADSGARTGSARGRRAAGERRRRAARHAGGFRRLSADRAVVGLRALTSGSAARRALRR